ncbi:cell wall hydrolase [Cupriavidus metallidurans]|uniref:cell wall hydrolase n=1 Tax=Cupriavidus metallidurans TaxID=119219 RepID=UPI001CCBD533|nr:cell wall hydrolase [Cupriavidus metallidurans]UBM12713.1 cell wall hydrolase [Cupriavidus metallidurans]
MLEQAILCLAINIFKEARGEPILGQYAVAQVTMNRAAGDPQQVCREIGKPHQFSWTRGTGFGKGEGAQRKIARQAEEQDAFAWVTAQKVARMVVTGKMTYDFTKGADHYHAVYVKPEWAKSFQQTFRVGQHIFYRSK